MAWKVKSILDAIYTMLLIVVSPIVAEQGYTTVAVVLAAVAIAIKAATNYLFEQGVIVSLGKSVVVVGPSKKAVK